MPQFDPRPFNPPGNINLMNAIRRRMSSDYQARIPEATKANLKDTQQKIVDYSPNRNEFLNGLVNLIGLQISKSVSWSNPLSKFKRGLLTYGETIEEIQVGLVKSKTYDPNREYLERDIWGTERPDVQTSFHTRNRQNVYKISINKQELTKAFYDEQGLSTLISQIMASINTSDEWDEFLLMSRLFREYHDNGGFFKVRIPDVASIDSDSTEAKAALRAVRQMAETLPFISEQYNAARMPVAAKADELELFVTPEFNAAIDVEALAAAFNVERALIPTRQTVLRQQDMNIPGAQAILTTRDFFVVADTYYETEQINNPMGRVQNWFLHHDQIISASRFVPAILFTSTEPGDVITITDPNPTAIGPVTVYDTTGTAVTDLARNAFYNVKIPVTTTGDNDAAIMILDGATSNFTKLNDNGTLFVGYDEKAETLTITGVSEFDETKTVMVEFDVTGEIGQLWPDPQVIADTPTP